MGWQKRHIGKRLISCLLAGVMLFGDSAAYGSLGGETVYAEESEKIEVTSMQYYEGKTSVTETGVGEASFGIVSPLFNGKPYTELKLDQVWDDLAFEEYRDGEWQNIDQSVNPESPYTWNSDWAWELGADWDNYVFWIKLDHSAKVRLRSVSHPDVYLEYQLNFNELDTFDITSLTYSGETNKQISAVGETNINFRDFVFNGNADTLYVQVENDLEFLVDNHDGKGFVPLFSNADSGFIWDQNFGMWYEDKRGLWFTNQSKSFTVRAKKKSADTPYVDINFTYEEPVRDGAITLTANGDTFFDLRSDKTAATCIKHPKINGTEVYQSDLDHFVYQICEGAVYSGSSWSGGTWIGLSDSENWIYQDSGYNKYALGQQWGYDVVGNFGIWFQPVKTDSYIRFGYRKDGESVDDINNWVYYTILGNPDADSPDPKDLQPLDDLKANDQTEPSGDVASEDVPVPDGWSLVWNDEFNGTGTNGQTGVDYSKWTNQTGFLLDENDASTSGWGNKELEHYTDSDKNTHVGDGMLKFTLLKDKKVFTDTQGREATALYSSGKLISQHKFSVKYGRVDFRAKLPDGTGVWPALWMMPNDDIYGTWASSGEIDVMEGRGRTPDVAFGTLHYGSQWPADLESGDKMSMTKTVGSDMTSWHVYSLVWEEGVIKMYVDGQCFMMRKADAWNSAGAPGNNNAPFDQRFYIVMNLAVGGYFDGLSEPDYDTFTSKEMCVDYVRVYQKKAAPGEDEKNDDTSTYDKLAQIEEQSGPSNGKDDGLYGDYRVGVPAEIQSVKLNPANVSLSVGETQSLEVEILPSGVKYDSIEWKIDNESVATIAGDGTKGTVTAVSAGTAEIEVLVDKKHVARCEVEVTKPAQTDPSVTDKKVTKIELDRTEESMHVGDSIHLEATLTPDDATNQNVTWTSSNTDVADIVTDGKNTATVNAKSEGTTTITATANGGDNVKATCQITVNKQDNPEENAKYTIKYYKQNTQLNGYDDPVIERKTGKIGEEVTAAAKNFKGFVCNPNAAGTKEKGTIEEGDTLELSVYYDRQRYGITYQLDGGTNSAGNPKDYVYGIGVEAFEEPTKEGYVFDGWFESEEYTDANRIVSISTGRTGEVTVFARWIKRPVIDAAKPVVSIQQSASAVEYLDNVTLTATAKTTDTGVLSYQWYKNTTKSSVGGTPITGATSATYHMAATTMGNTYYYVVVTNTNNSADGAKTASTESNILSVFVEKATNPLEEAPSQITKIAGGKAFVLETGVQGPATYTSKNKKVAKINKTTGKVTIKGAGKTVITVKAKGNEFYEDAVKKITLTVKPMKANLKSVKSTAPGTITVSWKKDTKKATGYQIQYARKSSFKGKKTETITSVKKVSKTISGLKGGAKYYVRVCAYKKDGRKKITGPWSKKKTVIVKK